MSERKESLRAELETSRAYLLSVTEQIDPKRALLPTENPLWTVRDILAHLAGAEPGLQATVHRFLAGQELPEGFSLDYWNRRQVEKRQERSVAELLASLAASREETRRLLDSLSEEQLDVPGRHAAGFETTVEGVFRILAFHERSHGQEIAAALGLEVGERATWRP